MALPDDADDGHIRLDDLTFLEVFDNADPQVQVLVKVGVLIGEQIELLAVLSENLDVLGVSHARMDLQDIVRRLLLFL